MKGLKVVRRVNSLRYFLRGPLGRPHVHGHRLDPRPAGQPSLPEGIQRIGDLAVTDEHHRTALEVHDTREVAVPLGHGGLADGDGVQVLNWGWASRRERSRFWMSLIVYQPTSK